MIPDLMLAYYERGFDYLATIFTDLQNGHWSGGVWLLGAALIVPAFLMTGRRPKRRKRQARALRRYRHGEQRALTFRRHAQWRKEALRLLRLHGSGRLSAPELSDQLQGMNPYAFEYLIIELFKRRGHSTRKIKRASGDGGIDGMVHINGRWHLIQAKRYQGPVSQAPVGDFIELARRKRMPGLFVAINGYTKGALSVAQTSPFVRLVDVNSLFS